MQSKVSVIIPAYNVEKYIERSINSVLSQTLFDIEIIVVNDGSTDDTERIIDKIIDKNKQIRKISKENGGLSSARNIGIENATGEYILHLDGDDWIENDCAELLYNYASNNKLDIVITDILIDYDNGRVELLKDLIIDKILNPEQYLIELFSNNSFPSVVNKLIKRDLYLNVRHPINISLGEDLATIPKLVINSKRIGKFDGSFLHYIQNEGSISKRDLSTKIYQLFDVFRIVEFDLSESCISPIVISKFNSYKLSHLINLILSRPQFFDKNFQLAVRKMTEVLKLKYSIPKKMSFGKKMLLNFLMLFPFKINVIFVITIVSIVKYLRDKFRIVLDIRKS